MSLTVWNSITHRLKYFNIFPWIYLFRHPLSPHSPFSSHLFPNIPTIKVERILSFCVKTAEHILYRHFYFQYISLFLLYKNVSFKTCIGSWKENPSTWDGQIEIIWWKHSSPKNLLFNSITSTEVKSTRTSAFSLKSCM